MATEFALPELGENIEKGDVVRVLVKPGDTIKKDQPVIELETDKATIEVPSSVAGKVTEVRVKAGEKVNVGQTVLVVDSGAAESAAPPADKPADNNDAADKPEAAEKAEAKPAPDAVAATTKAERPQAKPDDEEDAASEPEEQAAPKPSGKSAEVVEFAARPSAQRSDNARQDAPAAAAARRSEAPAARSASPDSPSVAAAPSVRRYARELGVDITHIPGSGPGGRIGQQDVTAFVKHAMTSGGGRSGGAAAAPLPDFSKWGEVESKPMSNIRRKTAEHLSAAWQAPHVTQHDRADVTTLEEFRKTYGPRVEKAGGKLTVTAVLIKICALAIDRFPQFASSADMAHQAIVYKHYRHIGVAVDTPNGLLVPVIRDVPRKTITEIAIELGALSQKARDRKLTLDEMSGGVFSISNLGGIGGTAFTPIINQPEVAILGVSRGATEPVWLDGAFVPRQLLPLSLSYDHRVIDGADAARFLRWVAEALEQPISMLL
jgi:pyruvate dehydrogenase E2 component (dihydrolipoamide acetyltransferase)